jgi:KDO2-lipid IV(A) lauroyltransferase
MGSARPPPAAPLPWQAPVNELRRRMSALVYYLSLPLLYAISVLPFPLLYVLSDLLFPLVYHVIGYRREVVRTNLRNSFPGVSQAELRSIERRFYRWFCDLWLETLKTLTISSATVERTVVMGDHEALKKYHALGRSVILVMGHLGNWELGGARFSQLGLHRLHVIYHPLSNPYFERLIVQMRTRLGNRLYAMNEVLRCMLRDRGRVTATAFIADQSPPPESATWLTFLNQDTAVFNGTEKIARKLGYPVLYVHITRERRGRYRMAVDELVADPAATAPGEITAIHTARLEEDIRRQPGLWLWTHRRWKHKRPTM